MSDGTGPDGATDLLALTAELVAIASVSRHEAAIADHVEDRLRQAPWLTVDRIDHNVVARTTLGHDRRLILAGHLDTVPPAVGQETRIEGDTLWGLGAADMKAGLAVHLALACELARPGIDVTYVFYAAEEIAAVHNGLGHLLRHRPDLLVGDLALVGEPTGGQLEAGCQGTLRATVTFAGQRAHTARPWMGRNAVHRTAPLLAAVASWEGRHPVVEGCRYRESLQVVAIEGGVAGNVVPDQATVTINHRFAPDRDEPGAIRWLEDFVGPHLAPGDRFEVVDQAPAARPGLDHPLLRALVERNALEVHPKVAWTDVARFAAVGTPASNFGPGDPRLAHHREERVDRVAIERTHGALRDLLLAPP